MTQIQTQERKIISELSQCLNCVWAQLQNQTLEIGANIFVPVSKWKIASSYVHFLWTQEQVSNVYWNEWTLSDSYFECAQSHSRHSLSKCRAFIWKPTSRSPALSVLLSHSLRKLIRALPWSIIYPVWLKYKPENRFSTSCTIDI